MWNKTAEFEHWRRQLQHKDWNVRWDAARRLRRLKDSRVIPLLLRALPDESWIVRGEIAGALGELGDARLTPQLIAILTGSQTYLRVYAAMILGKLKDPRAVMPLTQALADSHWFGRAQAAWALGEIGDRRALGPLTQTLHDLDSSVQDASAMAIKTIYASIHTVLFGTASPTAAPSPSSWYNPDVQELSLPLSGLKLMKIHADTHDFRLVERFLTYAINQIGQKYLKRAVTVRIYGDPAKVHPNLRNNFAHLCKQIQLHA
jgi:hypothetical protein